jgi:hypothetical protein
MAATEKAPQAVQEFRRIVRRDCKFLRGVDATADRIVDDCLAWVIADVFAGEIKTPSEAARQIGTWLRREIG